MLGFVIIFGALALCALIIVADFIMRNREDLL